MRGLAMRLGLSFLSISIIYPLWGAEPVGIFEDSVDVGEPSIPGFAKYEVGKYIVDAVGETIGLEALNDQFHFVFKKMTGNFAIQGTPVPLDNVGRGGLMIRQDLDPDSVHASLMLTSEAAKEWEEALEFSVFPTFRSLKGGGTKRQGDPEPGGLTNAHTGPIRLERIGNSFYFYTVNATGKKILIRTEIVPMTDEVYAGLAATAEMPDGLGTFEFSNVTIEEYPVAVIRQFPAGTHQKGKTLSPITLTAAARAGLVADVTVAEPAPLGTSIANAKASAGTLSAAPDGTVSWFLSGLSGTAVLTYDLKWELYDSVAFSGTFHDGLHPKSYTGGDAVLAPAFAFSLDYTPTPVDPAGVTLLQAERGVPNTDTDAWSLMLDSRILSGIAAVAVNSNVQSALEFPITITQEGTYYIFGKVRGDDGNSDSFYLEVDDLPAGDNITVWDLTGDKRYVVMWATGRNENASASIRRSFDLAVGEHSIFLSGRENDASIDWLAITMKSNQNINTYVERPKPVVTGVESYMLY